jgi:hypothetical protein
MYSSRLFGSRRLRGAEPTEQLATICARELPFEWPGHLLVVRLEGQDLGREAIK